MVSFKQIAGAALAVAFVAGTASAQSPREIKFALPSKSIVASPPRIAEAMGLFAKHGLKPNFSYIDSTAQTAMSILSKSVDFGVTGTAEVITAEAKGQHLVLVANHYNGIAGSLVLSKTVADKLGVSPTAPVADRLKALNNVLLASVSRISSLTLGYKGAANSVGAEPRFTYMAVGAMNAALESAAVEGIIVTAPFWTVSVLKGSGVLWLSPAKDLPPNSMPSSASATVTTRDFATANPDVVKRVAAVFDELSAAFEKRPAEVKAAIAQLYPDLDAKTLDLVFAQESKAFVTKPFTAADVAHDIKYMINGGGDFGPIDKIDPAAVVLKR
jgi:ABC-type nitrate/sulfonate/bicarbonate transport system substrate-binding protein